MATKLQDYQAKRKELQATNQNATMLDAKLALSPAPIANAPVAGVAPAITPIAPVAPIPEPVLDNKAIAEQNKANVQSEIQAGTRPEVGQAPVTPIAPAPTPVTPAPVVPVAPVTPTPEVKTPKVEPVVIPPTDKKGILNALVTGQPVTPTNTPEFRKATAIHTGFQKFNGMTDVQLLDNLKQGQITTEMGSLLASNPNYQIAKKKLDDIQSTQATNNTMNYLKTGIAGKTVDTPNYLESLSNDLVKKYGLVDQSSQEAFKEIVSNDPEVVDYTNQLHEINRQVADTTQLINDGMKEFKQNYQGKLSASEMLNYMGNRFRDATDNLNALNNTKTYLTADLKNATDMAVAEYGAKQADIQQMNSMRNQIFGQAVQSQFALASKLQEQSLADELAVQAQNDPTKAIPILIEQYAKLGVPMQRSTQAMIAEAQNVIANGGTLADYLTDLQGKIQGKPEYQAILAKKAGEGTSYVQYGDKVYKNENGVLTLTDINPKSAQQPVWQEWTDSNGVKQAGWITPGVNPTTSTGVKGTGNIVPVTAGGKTVRLDQVGASGFENAVNQLTANGTPLVIGQGERDQVATIKSMAEKAGIPFNVNNPAETAGKLRAKGMQVADPGKSNHESGMAIDVYGSSKLDAVTPEQEKVLNANGWYSAGIPGDAGHFEYRGGGAKTTGTPLSNLGQFMIDNQDRGTGYSNDDVKAFNEKIERLVKAGDENGMAIAYRNMLMKDKDFKKEFDDTQKFIKALDTVQTMVNDYEKAGKDTNALKKVAETVGRKLGLTTDTALAQLQTQMGVTMANYIKAISGTAASDAEVARLMGNMANIGNISELNTAILSTVKDNAQNGLKSMIDTRMYGMPEDLKPKVFGDIYGQTSQTPQDKWSAITDILSKALSNKPQR